MIKELRKLITTWLLLLAFKTIPDGEFKISYTRFMIDNINQL